MAQSNAGDIPDEIPAICTDRQVVSPGSKLKMSFSSPKSSPIHEDLLLRGAIAAGAIIGVFSKRSSKGFDDIIPGDIGTAAQINEVNFKTSPTLQCSISLTGLCKIEATKILQKEPICLICPTIVDVDGDSTSNSLEDFLSNLRGKSNRLPFKIPAKDAITVLTSNDWKMQLFQLILKLIGNAEDLNHYDGKKEGNGKSKRDNQTKSKGSSSLSSVKKMLKGGKHAGVGMFESDDEDEMADLENKITESGMPDYAMKEAKRELKRLKKIPAHFPDHAPLRHYVEWMTSLPWAKQTEDSLDISKARTDLDRDHFGLDTLKKRVIEYLAVRKLKNSLKGPILCFVGPPGVGKTSVGKSIANTLGRKFQRISIGGTCDQSDIRGHRRTYIGSMPGRILNALKAAGSRNAVVLLDEIDKMGKGYHGDPSAALLEVLDPEQNHTFTDHYLNLPFDLSQVLFIATANSTATIPAPLLDRMEVIKIPGYTLQEKTTIAERHLIPKQIEENGLTPEKITIPKDTIHAIISRYTREAGVRSLERRLGAVCRNTAVKLVGGPSSEESQNLAYAVKTTDLEDILGTQFYQSETAQRISIPGVATGLAWTSVGGEIMFVEATKMGGDRKISYTGQLGDVMKESAQLALSWIRSHAVELGLTETVHVDLINRLDIHLHFPAGAVGKDGPSAGIAIATALVSLFSGKMVRSDTAMTGEITLQGLVLPVGGIKDKVLAAHRADIKRVILPKRNKKDLKELPEDVKKGLKFILVDRVEEVLVECFEDRLQPLPTSVSSKL